MSDGRQDGPRLSSVLERIFEDQFGQLRVGFPGVARDFDRSGSKTVTVDTWIRETPAVPSIPRVPVVFPGLVWDISDGTPGWVLVSDKHWLASWRSGSTMPPEVSSSHQVSNCAFLPFLRSRSSATSFIVGANETIVPNLCAGGEIKLGDSTATESLLLGDSFADEMTRALPVGAEGFLTALTNWVNAVNGVVGPLPTTPILVAAIVLLNTGLSGTWLSSEVKTK
jgi:hypothetical protein